MSVEQHSLFDDPSEDANGDWLYGNPTPRPTASREWLALATREPRLLDLERDLLHGRRERNYWPAWVKASGRLRKLVGWFAEKPELRDRRHYEVAFKHLVTVHEDRQEGFDERK